MRGGSPRRSVFPTTSSISKSDFATTVVRNFVDEYAAGRTPIPCVHCNADLKFASLVERAAGLDADAVATGHYARVAFDDERAPLPAAAQRRSGQGPDVLPVLADAGSAPARDVPRRAPHEARGARRGRARGSLVADKPDSHEICFVPDGETGDFVERQLETVPRRGRHRRFCAAGRLAGIAACIATPSASGGVSESPAPCPLYVLKIDAGDSRVVVGPREELGRTALTASEVNWIAGAPPVRASPGDRPDPPSSCRRAGDGRERLPRLTRW